MKLLKVIKQSALFVIMALTTSCSHDLEMYEIRRIPPPLKGKFEGERYFDPEGYFSARVLESDRHLVEESGKMLHRRDFS